MASLPLQLFITFDHTFQLVFFALTLLGCLYKAFVYDYVVGYFIAEVIGICALFALQWLRLFIGSKGNKTETSNITVWFLLVTLITCATNLYYIQY